MNDPVILFVKPSAISADDKAALHGAGVIVVEMDDPQSVKLTRACAELSASQMLASACAAIKSAGFDTQAVFAQNICTAIMRKAARP